MFTVNAKTAYFFIREAGRRLRDDGKIVTIVTSLLAAFTGLYSTYAGSKACVEHFTRAAAKEFGARGISVNNVAPGRWTRPFSIRRRPTMRSPITNRRASTAG
jgi:NAD(P)-dependent dehydrogenase (short-subunit alcohol dehydrogenase family)